MLALLVVVVASVALADHGGRNQNRGLRQGRRFGGRRGRPAPVNNVNNNNNRFNNFQDAGRAIPQPIAAPPRTQVVRRRRPRPQAAPLPPVQEPLVQQQQPVAVPARRRPQGGPRAGKSIDVEGTQFLNSAPDENGNYNFR